MEVPVGVNALSGNSWHDRDVADGYHEFVSSMPVSDKVVHELARRVGELEALIPRLDFARASRACQREARRAYIK
jgi:hypothetical protein